MNKNHFFFLFLVLLLVQSACLPLYQPNSVNVPLFDSAHDTRANVNLGSGGTDVQGAFAVNEQVAVMVNASFIRRSGDSSGRSLKRDFLEGGIGVYKTMGLNGRASAFGGYGYGRLTGAGDYPRLNGSTGNYKVDLYYHRLFIQPSIGIRTKFFRGALTSRFSYISLREREDTWNRLFWEPTATLKFGGDLFRFTMQGGFVLPLDGIGLVGYNPLIANIGLEFSLPTHRIRP